MYDFKAKTKNIEQLNRYMLAKTIPMFEYSELPESIPYRELERMLQVSGYVFITQVEGVLYAFTGGLGGVQDAYGNPTEIVIANPYLKFNKTLNIEKDGVLIRNDDLMIGLMPLYEKINFLTVENDINMVVQGYNTRMNRFISAPDDRTKESAESFVKKSIDGEIAVIGENGLFDGVKQHTVNGQQSTTITSMIEYNQYLKGTLYNEVGLSANFNMKRERLVSAEVEQGEDSLFPFVYSMMKCRIKGIEQVNEKYQTNITIDFGSVWFHKHREMVDDVVEEDLNPNPSEEKSDEPELENSSDGTNSGDTGNSDPKEEIASIDEMLEDETLTDEDKKTLLEMKAELEGAEK